MWEPNYCITKCFPVNLLAIEIKKKTKKVLNTGNICYIGDKDYQQELTVSYSFVSDKPLSNLLEIASKTFIFLKPFNPESEKIEVWFTSQNSQQVEVEHRINWTLVFKWYN